MRLTQNSESIVVAKRQSKNVDEHSGKVVSPTHRRLLNPPEIFLQEHFLVLISVSESTPGHRVTERVR
jgi:hypothetical protein